MNTRAIVLHPDDNVATALDDIARGDVLNLAGREVRAVDAIPFGHKIALTAIAENGTILKYGESIGLARGAVAAGSCVHVHNVESQRGRGDLAAARRENA